LEFHTISLSDKYLFDKYLNNDPRSAYSFITNYIWCTKDNVKIAETSNCLVILWETKSGIYMQYPQGQNTKEALEECCKYFDSIGITPDFRFLNEKEIMELRENFPQKFIFDYDRDNCDYVYETEKLISLSGKKLHSKKNHTNAFKRRNNFLYRRLCEADIPACKELFRLWFSEKDSDIEFTESAKKSTFTLLDNIEALNLVGGVIEVDGRIIACSVGEKATDDTAIIHVEFADRSFNGSYAIINQQFVSHEWQDTKFINREEDMGDDGLRKAKESYQPIKLLETYTAKRVD